MPPRLEVVLALKDSKVSAYLLGRTTTHTQPSACTTIGVEIHRPVNAKVVSKANAVASPPRELVAMRIRSATLRARADSSGDGPRCVPETRAYLTGRAAASGMPDRRGAINGIPYGNVQLPNRTTSWAPFTRWMLVRGAGGS